MAGSFGCPLSEPKETAMKTYKVIRQHYGDRKYMPGDTREANASDVKNLVDAGVLK